ncbi:nucleotidyl transferase AbiEii/AbiGii toxin family protein [Paramicrobacterium chengjingii]|uniref:Nucleotidyl transferase AbiEii/AbiGii toxin family protein n=1 Tax=Paramicrobacterium chengjingii TaxID=2769067 RepID=A0ABX6YGI0_9MICO|nr:nucleotidyl transferase AbiEii/AbiGii toxin family protein [Microbacterium chengjingii]QPZ37500.1 nucleotidyl transferase AbiEii/AbiGii toxin family protein [Microbacterium chengjingii]
MTPNPQHGTPAGDATLAIQRLARQTAGDVQELQTLYVLEALLARLAESEHRDDFVLKGGVLLAAFAVRRSTKDIDLQATGIANDETDVAERIREVVTIDLPDGVIFDPDSITASTIRDDDEYAGIRVKLVGLLGRARLTVGIDVNFGDPIWPAPRLIELPRIVALDQPPVEILGYPLTMVLAEKIITAIDRGPANTRWRDFADIYTLTRVHSVPADDLVASLGTVAEYRRVAMRPLLPTLERMPRVAQPKWRTWRTRVQRESDLPLEFTDVLNTVANFSDPALTQVAKGNWDVQTATWPR